MFPRLAGQVPGEAFEVKGASAQKEQTGMASNRRYCERVAARTTEAQRASMERAAKRAGLDLGTWARVVLIAAADVDGSFDDGLRAAREAGE